VSSRLAAPRSGRLNVSRRARRHAAVACLTASGALLATFVWAQARRHRAPAVSVPLASPPAAASVAAPAPAPAAGPAVDHVLLLTIDSLRGDQPWTGYERARTPNLSALAERSVVYERAYAVANLTAASVAAVLSGRYPSELERSRCAVAHYRLGEGLAPFLKASGVATAAAHGSAMFDGRTAPSDGFDEWRLIEGAAGLSAQRNATTGAAVAALVEASLAAPAPAPHRFVWAHFIDPRYDYAPHADFPPSDHPTRGAYDGEVAYTDAMIGRVLDALGRSPLAGRTAVVVAGSNGEAFGEHGHYRHGRSAYDEEFRVPLMLHVPGVAPARIATPRSLIDLAPTVAALFRLTPPAHWRGRPLLDDLGPDGPVTRPVFFDSPEWRARPPLRAVVMGQTKVVLEKGFSRLYDLGADAGERAPIADKRTVPAVKLARDLISRLPFVPSSPCAGEATDRPFNPIDAAQFADDPSDALPASAPPPGGAPTGDAPQGNAPGGAPPGNAPGGAPPGNAPGGVPQGETPPGNTAPAGGAAQGAPAGGAARGAAGGATAPPFDATMPSIDIERR
jgi:choline-sulfatase